MKKLFLCFCLCAGFSASAQQAKDTTIVYKEDDFYKLSNVPIPEDVQLEVGGMTFMPDDALAVCTRRGEVWIIHNPYGKNGGRPRYSLFAEGLHEALGLNYINGDLYVTQRSEITRLKDHDGNGEADEYETVYSWPLSGNYHEYAYGPVLDKDSNLVVTLNLAWTNKEESQSLWHGWMVKITPSGKLEPFAAGLRSPAAFMINKEGDIFYSENQGGWVGSGYLAHVEQGDFLGNPESLKWAHLPGSPVKLKASDIPDTGEPKYEVAKRVKQLKTPAVWFPQSILGISTSGILAYDERGKMGPYAGQLFVGDQGQSKIMRVDLEKINGVYQGVAFPFREGFRSGVLRMNWGSDGSMFVGMTSRGWGSTGPDKFGMQRLEFSEKTPFEMQTIKAKPDGFEIHFTQPVNAARAKDIKSYLITGFTYKYGHDYGSPVINSAVCAIRAIEVADDKMSVRLVIDSLREGYIHEIRCEGIRSSENVSLLHDFGYYTLNQIPAGKKLEITNANRVQPSIHTGHKMTPSKPRPVATKSTSVKRQLSQPAAWAKASVQNIVITPIPGLKFSMNSFVVKAGAKIKFTFRNTDDMLHNVVFTTPNSADDVGSRALNLGLDGEKMNFVPASEQVLFHTSLLQPGKSETIYFSAPLKPGEYPFVCTYPGHYLVMRGIMKVVE